MRNSLLVPTAEPMYAAQLLKKPPVSGWFSIADVAHRLGLSLKTFYTCLCTKPKQTFSFAYKHHTLWYGKWLGSIFTLFLPANPAIFALVAWTKRANETLNPFSTASWQMAGPGRIFFQRPSSFTASLLYDVYTTLNNFVGHFVLYGNDDDGIAHTWYDSICTKDFWFGLLDAGGARRPQQLATWDGAKLHDVGEGVEYGSCSIVCKLSDSYLGIGDRVFHRGGERESSGFTKRLEIEQRLQQDAEYTGKNAVLCERMTPTSKVRLSSDTFENNVHSLDIVTLKCHDGAKVLSMLLWTDCADWSSHSASAGYIVDVNSEIIVGPCAWYGPYFASQPSSLIGRRVPGAQEAARKAIAAHEACTLPWLNAVGWDAMITDDGPIFFEGNVAAFRVPRRITLSKEANRGFCHWMDAGRGIRAVR